MNSDCFFDTHVRVKSWLLATLLVGLSVVAFEPNALAQSAQPVSRVQSIAG